MDEVFFRSNRAKSDFVLIIWNINQSQAPTICCYHVLKGPVHHLGVEEVVGGEQTSKMCMKRGMNEHN